MILFIFRRDLRLKDNTGLINAIKKAESTNTKVICSFIFTPMQISNNDYKSSNSIQFMVESLKEVDTELKKLGTKLHPKTKVFGGILQNECKDLLDKFFISRRNLN